MLDSGFTFGQYLTPKKRWFQTELDPPREAMSEFGGLMEFLPLEQRHWCWESFLGSSKFKLKIQVQAKSSQGGWDSGNGYQEWKWIPSLGSLKRKWFLLFWTGTGGARGKGGGSEKLRLTPYPLPPPLRSPPPESPVFIFSDTKDTKAIAGCENSQVSTLLLKWVLLLASPQSTFWQSWILPYLPLSSHPWSLRPHLIWWPDNCPQHRDLYHKLPLRGLRYTSSSQISAVVLLRQKPVYPHEAGWWRIRQVLLTWSPGGNHITSCFSGAFVQHNCLWQFLNGTAIFSKCFQ